MNPLEACACGTGMFAYNPSCVVHGSIGPVTPPKIDFDARSWGTITTTNGPTCGNCGIYTSTLPCPNCEHCDTCDDSGNIVAKMPYTPPGTRGILFRDETTWCPDCPEGQVWKELLDG